MPLATVSTLVIEALSQTLQLKMDKCFPASTERNALHRGRVHARHQLLTVVGRVDCSEKRLLASALRIPLADSAKYLIGATHLETHMRRRRERE